MKGKAFGLEKGKAVKRDENGDKAIGKITEAGIEKMGSKAAEPQMRPVGKMMVMVEAILVHEKIKWPRIILSS